MSASEVREAMESATEAQASPSAQPVASEEVAAEEDLDSDDDEDSGGFDYAALEQAKQLVDNGSQGASAEPGQKRSAADPLEGEPARKKQRGPRTKETNKRRKKQRRQDDILRAKEAGLPAPWHVPPSSVANADVDRPCVDGASTTAATEDSSVVGAQGAAMSPSPAAEVACAVAATNVVGDSPVRPAPLDYSDAAECQSNPSAAVARVAKENARRAKIAEARSSQTVFVTNLPFKIPESELRDWLSSFGTIRQLTISRDKGTHKVLGYCHVEYEALEVAEALLAQDNLVEKQGRIVRMGRAGEKLEFLLPEGLKDDIRALMKEKYEGANISTLKDAWQIRHEKQKLDVAKWGFKNFSSAMRTIAGITLEKHIEKGLTYLAFFQDSPAHNVYLEQKKLKEEKAKEEAAKRAASPAEGVKFSEDAAPGSEEVPAKDATEPAVTPNEEENAQAA